MRTRHMSLTDHGIPPEDKQKLYTYCRSHGELLRQAIASAAPGLEDQIYDSLTLTGNRKGYETLSKKEYIPATKADFYGYQRKALAEFYRMLRLLGMWED